MECRAIFEACFGQSFEESRGCARRASISPDAVKVLDGSCDDAVLLVRCRSREALRIFLPIPMTRTTTRLFDLVVGSRSIRPHTCLTTPAPKALHESPGQRSALQAFILGESRLNDAERERCRLLYRLRLWRRAVDRRKSRRRRTDQRRRADKAATTPGARPRALGHALGRDVIVAFAFRKSACRLCRRVRLSGGGPGGVALAGCELRALAEGACPCV